MKTYGTYAAISLALVLMTALSVLYWQDVGLKAAAVSSSVHGRELPIYSVQTEQPQISITFDAAWGNEDTEKILKILQTNQVKATFFATGGWIEKYPEDVKRILEAGHDLGNHSENHKQMSQLSPEESRQEIVKPHEKVKSLTGYEMNLFRPPYGDYNNTVIRTAYSSGYYPIQWNVDSLDWKDYGVEDIINRVIESKDLGNGSIILMHNGAKYTAEALDTLIKKLKEKGYQLVPVSELIYKENYHMDASGKQIPDNLSNEKRVSKV